MTMISLDDTLDASHFHRQAAEQRDFVEGERREFPAPAGSAGAGSRPAKKVLDVRATPTKEELESA